MKFRLFCKLFGSLSCYSKTMLLKVTVEQWHAKSTHGKSWMEEVNDTIKRLENHGSPRTFSMDQVKGTWFFGLLMWFCGFACKLARTTPTTPSPEIAQQKYTQICTHTHTCISLHLCAHPHARILVVVLCKTASASQSLTTSAPRLVGYVAQYMKCFRIIIYGGWHTRRFSRQNWYFSRGSCYKYITYICMWYLSLILYASNEKRSQLQLPPISPTTVGFNRTRQTW